MVDKTDEDEIEVTLEAPPEVEIPEGDIPPVLDPPAKAVEPEEGIEALRLKLADSERGREDEARRRQDAESRAANAGKEVQDTNLTLVTTAIAQVTAASERLEADYAQALQDSDFAAAAKIQREMSKNEVNLQSLEAGKKQLEEDAKRPPPQEISGDPVDVLANQLSPRSASWVRSHPEYARDPRLYQRMLAAHNLAMSEDIKADSDEYFAAIEGTLKIGKPAAVREVPPESALSAAAEPTRAPPPAAPVRGGGGGGAQTVRLSAAEREIAQMSGMTDQEYAANKLALTREGKIN